jgi:hypothetical protein
MSDQPQPQPEHIFSEYGLEAYRQLYFADNVPLLVSGSYFVWEPDKRVRSSSKTCQSTQDRPHPHIGGGCTCGIYSYNSADHLYGTYIQHPGSMQRDSLQCMVKLYLTGRVVRHQWGYRSQYAQIAEVFVLYNHEDAELSAMLKAAELGNAYAVAAHQVFNDPADRRWTLNVTTQRSALPKAAVQQTLSFDALMKLWENRTLLKMSPQERSLVRSQLYRRLYERQRRLTKRVPALKRELTRCEQDLNAVTTQLNQLLKEH